MDDLRLNGGTRLVVSSAPAVLPADDLAAVRTVIAHHAAEALRLADDQRGALVAYGSEGWAKAKWHLHVAHALETLLRTDPAAAQVHVREQSMKALAAAAKP